MAEKRLVEKNCTYSPTYFLPYENHISTPRAKSNLKKMHRYDYRMLKIIYYIYTIESSDGYQMVTSIWDATHRTPVEELELLVN